MAQKRRAYVQQQAKPQAASIPTEEQLAQEYSYVLTDLRKIGILAAALLVLLIVLAFVLV